MIEDVEKNGSDSGDEMGGDRLNGESASHRFAVESLLDRVIVFLVSERTEEVLELALKLYVIQTCERADLRDLSKLDRRRSSELGHLTPVG